MQVIPNRDKDGQYKTKIEAFSAKTVILNGVEKSLFKRIHGKSFNAVSGQLTTYDFVMPYANAKFEALEIINGDIGDYVNFKVLDTASGSISGVPNYMLNQFGFEVMMDKSGYYEQRSQYDADVIAGMQMRLEYFNAGNANKTIYINYIMNEVK